MEVYTNTQAIKDTLQEWKPGVVKHGTDIQREVIARLRIHGSYKTPMDSTVLRIMRFFKDEYGIKLHNRATSAYVKEVPEQPTLY